MVCQERRYGLIERICDLLFEQINPVRDRYKFSSQDLIDNLFRHLL